MKKFLALIIIFSSIISSFAQSSLGNQWVVVGVRGSFNSTWLLNKNELGDKGIKYKPSWGGSGGIMVGAHYCQWGAVYIEGLYSTLSQKTTSGIDSVKWNNRTNLTYYEFPILLYFTPKEFKYIEAGIKISTLAAAKSTYSSSGMNYSNQDAKNSFEKSNFSLVFGWGSAIWGDQGGIVDLGIRITYGLTDIISTAGGKGKDYYPIGDGIPAKPKPYLSTNTATIGFHLKYDFDLGWWLHDNCRRKYKFFLFHHG